MASSFVSAFDVAVASLAYFEDAYEQVELMSATLNQEYDDTGALVDVVDVGFRIRGRPGIFVVHPQADINWQAQASFLIQGKKIDVEGIYAGYASQADIPEEGIGAPLVPLGVEVAA